MNSSRKKSAHLIKHFCRNTGFCILLSTPAVGLAQQWQFEPIVSVTAEYDDNSNLAPEGPEKVDTALLSVDVNGRFVYRAQASEVRIAPRVRSNTYTDDQFENTTDFFLDFFANKDFERGDLGFQARYAQENVLTAELDDPDFDNPDVNSPVNLDTGRIRIGSDRKSLILSPYFRHDWTETLGFAIGVNYVDVTYDNNNLNLTDYSDTAANAEIIFDVSELSSWSLGIYANDYEATAGQTNSDSKSVGAALIFRHAFSPTVAGFISGGYKQVDSDITSPGTTISTSDNVPLFAAGVTKEGEISRLVFEASQSVDPGGTGFLLERTQLRMRYTRQLAPTVYGSFDARIQRSEELSADSFKIARDFERFGVGIERRLTQKWSLRGDYIFTSQEFDGAAGTGSSNAVSIGVVFEPRRIR